MSFVKSELLLDNCVVPQNCSYHKTKPTVFNVRIHWILIPEYEYQKRLSGANQFSWRV